MPSTHVVVDLGFGDAGKGTMVDAIARRCSSPPLVVRHNGGAQAGHRVVAPDGREHVFSQFGAATFVPGSRTLLSKHFVFHPSGLLAENNHLISIGVSDALSRLVVDERALVISPYQQAANRLREMARGEGRHGTCGLGVGETVGDSLDHPDLVLRAGDLRDSKILLSKMNQLRELKLAQIEPLLPKLQGMESASEDLRVFRKIGMLEEMALLLYFDVGEMVHIAAPYQVEAQISGTEHVIFEGAQGVLLDEWHGFHPHTTWSTTTTKNADDLIKESGREGPVRRIGVLRAYSTRHGQGPFPTENEALTKALRDAANHDAGWQGSFRVGWFDLPLARYALSLCPDITELAVTCLDRLRYFPQWSMCEAYEVPPGSEERFFMEGGRASSLRPRAPGDLDYQSQLTRDLLGCRPIYQTVRNDDVGDYVRKLEQELDIPVAVQSFGPRAGDKLW